MIQPHLSSGYERFAPVIGRVLFGIFFLFAAYSHLPGTESFTTQVGYAGMAGLPFPVVMVTLAFVLELAAGLALVFGYKTRLAAFLLMLYIVLLTVLFHLTFADAMAIGFFFNHLAIIAGLLYLSTYGAQHAAIATCPLPKELSRNV